MCSIFAVMSQGPLMPAQIKAAWQAHLAMAHRGPDQSGHAHPSPETWLAAHRLALVGPGPDGAMPMANADGTAWIALNGTIYNDRALRSELEAKGYAFRTQSDTEVVLAAYLTWGESCVERLNGAFALVVLDLARNRALMCRDRFGAKPLYYAMRDGCLALSSEFGALCGCLPGTCDIDRGALTAYALCRFVPGDRTIFRDVFKLRPGEVVSITLAGLRMTRRRFWRPPDGLVPYDAGAFAAHLDEALRNTRRADVPSVTLLSGGLDSAAVAAAARLESVAFAFAGGVDEDVRDERGAAYAVANHLGLMHSEHCFPATLTLDDFVEMQVALGEPIASPNALGVFLSARALHGKCKLVVSGTGADELLGGYADLYFGAEGADLRGRKPHEILGAFSDYDRGTMPALDILRPELCDTDYVLQELEAAEIPLPAPGAPREMLNQLARFELSFALPGWELDQADRLFMRFGIEARAGFLENDFVTHCLRLPSSAKVDKAPLRRAMAEALPPDVVARPKYPSLGTPSALMRSSWCTDLQQEICPPAQDLLNLPLLRDGRANGCSADVMFRVVCLNSWFGHVVPDLSADPHGGVARQPESATL